MLSHASIAVWIVTEPISVVTYHISVNLLISILTSIACDYGDLQLVGGVVPYEGTVEICDESGSWVTICDELWSDSDATVVCRQLGYLADGEYIV